MLTKISSAGLIGTEGYIVACETDVSDGLPCFNMIGQLSSSVRESQDRVKTAIHNTGFHLNSARITVNLAPGGIKKEGTSYDFAIALSILCSYGYFTNDYAADLMKKSVFIGELSLSGKFLKVTGVLSLSIAARDAGFENIFVPKANEAEGAAIDGINCYGIESLYEMANILDGNIPLPQPAVYVQHGPSYEGGRDFADISGQEVVKRATIIAVAGRHNILYIGPAGTGKSMIASRIPGILPQMTKEECLEISKLYSICGLLPDDEPLLLTRPYRQPHHTISAQALNGGGAVPKPGEISLASGGVLFLDELAEFKPAVIDSIRQPLEDKKILISRVHSSIEFPADFVLCAATNPCKCGYYPDRTRCNCTELQVRNYLGKISKPVLDRIDICIETAPPRYKELKGNRSELTSSQIRKDIERVRRIQSGRLKGCGINFNSEMNGRMIDEFCVLSNEDNQFLEKYYNLKSMSARGLGKILKVARTIADFEDCDRISHSHLCEAITYRNLEEKYWGGGDRSDDRFTIRAL